MKHQKILSKEKLKQIIRKYKSKGKKVVWTNGCFDLIHSGHVRYLNSAKKLGDILIVGLNSDKSVRQLKGPDRPIQPQDQRAEVLAALDSVDYVTIFNDTRVTKILNYLKPDIFAKGGDYTLEKMDQNERKVLESYGAKIRFIPVEINTSTSKMLDKITSSETKKGVKEFLSNLPVKMHYDYKDYNEQKYETGFWNINRSKYKWFQNYTKLKIFSKWIKASKGKSVFLDAGGGVGNWTFYFLKDFKKCIVLDISENALAQIPEKEIVKLHGSILKIPLPDNSVDCILLADVFEHIFLNDLPKMLQELARILTKDGRIIIFTSENGYGIDLIFDNLLGQMRGGLTLADIECGHVNRLTLDEKRKLFVQAGLKLVDYYNYSIFFQQLTDFVKDSSAKIIGRLFARNKNEESGQFLKDRFKTQKEPSFVTRALFSIPTLISYLDIYLGRFIRGSYIFLLLEKSNKKE
jgi:rfaE bifunctional protein nucleotidyltransferase chain/domain